MVKLVSAKCPECGAALKLSKEDEKVKCEYCNNTIIVDDAIACYKLKLSGNVSVEGITTNAELVEAANELLDMKEFLKAKRKFLEFSEKCPDNYQGWLGLLICRTRNFTIHDNNIMFENDVKKFREHFFRTAPKDVKDDYFETIDRYFDPEKYERMEEEERAERLRKEQEEQRKFAEEEKKKKEEEKKKKAEDQRKKKEAKKKERQEKIDSSKTYQSVKDAAGKGKSLIFKIGNILLYILGALLILSSFGSKTPIGEILLMILLGVSLFKFPYTKIKEKFGVSDGLLLALRIIIPFVLLIVMASLYPVEEESVPEGKPCITFMNDGKKYDEICVKSGELVEAPENPVKKGYEFSHWATHEKSIDGSERYDFSKPLKDSQTVFAHFKGVVVKTPVPSNNTTPKKTTPKATGYQKIYNEYASKLRKECPHLSMTDCAKINNEGVEKMAKYMYSASGVDGQYATYEKWATKLMDVYTKVVS